MSEAVYLGYSQAQLDGLYRTTAMVANHQDYLDRFETWSEEIRRDIDCALDVFYGEDPRERLDIFKAQGSSGPAPVHLFFHGGYWRGSSKERYSFLARNLCPFGAVAVVVEYALIPMVNMDELVRQCRAALAWVWHNIADYGGDPSRLYVSGHSAGGHLVAMLMACDWAEFGDLPQDVVKGGVGVSGLYDLEPIRCCFLNETLGLDGRQVQANSPQYLPPRSQAPLLLVVGGDEGPEFIRQSQAMALTWSSQGADAQCLVLAGQNHYDMVQQMGQPDSPLGQALRRQMGLGGSAVSSS